ncbi:hypothetical protein TFLX_02448 [Thermoflexales bacterium]|nr:hypothetical protein TFLX_02448 [Thermoflexales bacterium]
MEVVRRDTLGGESKNAPSTPPLRLPNRVGDKMRNLRRDFLVALLLCAIIILVIIVTTDSAPQWIYQGF